jgi:hypothetical protein
MFPLPPCWDPLPGGTAAPIVGIGFPLLLVALVAVLACAAILGIDQARNRARRTKARRPETLALRSDAVIEIGRTTATRAAAGGRR